MAIEYLKLLKTVTLSLIKSVADWHRFFMEEEPWAARRRNNNLTVSSKKALGPLSNIRKHAFLPSDL